jgi:catechol 2,3-dioxygenase-like lactoylglutathione lyase family enzyme
MPLNFAASVVMVKDIEASRRFYEGLLGQVVRSDHGPNLMFAGGLSIWDAGHAESILYGNEPGKRINTGGNNIELYFESGDIDEDFARLQAAGVDMLQPVHEEPWAQRTFRCLDPDGHIIEVGERMEAVARRLHQSAVSPQDISKRLQVPIEFVLQAIGLPRYC